MSKTEIPKTIGSPAKNALEAHGYKYLEDLADIKEAELHRSLFLLKTGPLSL